MCVPRGRALPVTDLPPEFPRRPGGDGSCSHPWVRVVCGECGEPVELLGPERLGPESQTELPAVPPGGEDSRGVFIVARGHPDLVEQLKAVLGHSAEIQIIEDRRQVPRESLSPEGSASAVRTTLRRRILENEPAAGSDSG